jgi:hypothetical protein
MHILKNKKIASGCSLKAITCLNNNKFIKIKGWVLYQKKKKGWVSFKFEHYKSTCPKSKPFNSNLDSPLLEKIETDFFFEATKLKLWSYKIEVVTAILATKSRILGSLWPRHINCNCVASVRIINQVLSGDIEKIVTI